MYFAVCIFDRIDRMLLDVLNYQYASILHNCDLASTVVDTCDRFQENAALHRRMNLDFHQDAFGMVFVPAFGHLVTAVLQQKLHQILIQKCS